MNLRPFGQQWQMPVRYRLVALHTVKAWCGCGQPGRTRKA